MWHNHSFIQRKKTSKIALEVKLGGKGEEELDKILKRQCVGNIGGLYNIEGVRNLLPTMTHKELFWKKDVLIVQEKSMKRLVKDFIFCKFVGKKPLLYNKWAQSQVFLKTCLKFLEHLFRRIHFSGCFLKLYYSLTEVLQDVTLHTKRVVKINYDVPITSLTKLKKHKVRYESIQTYF